LALSCTQEEATWRAAEWGELPIDEKNGLVEGALEALGEHLSDTTSAEPNSKSAPSAPLDPPRPARTLEPDPPQRVFSAQRAFERRPSTGGVGLGVSLEHWADFGRWAPGPRLDVGVGSGPWALVSSEATLLSGTQRRVEQSLREYDLVLFDVGVSGHWGAPFSSSFPLGAGLGLFGEWFAARGEARDPRVATRFVPKLAASLCAAENLGPFSLWGGLRLGYRLADPTLAPPISAGLPRVSLVFQLGVLAVADEAR
jgi:hypothetical protein